jgi:hypothetical protein
VIGRYIRAAVAAVIAVWALWCGLPAAQGGGEKTWGRQ